MPSDESQDFDESAQTTERDAQARARIRKLEDRNNDLRGAIEEVRDLLDPYDLRKAYQCPLKEDGECDYGPAEAEQVLWHIQNFHEVEP